MFEVKPDEPARYFLLGCSRYIRWVGVMAMLAVTGQGYALLPTLNISVIGIGQTSHAASKKKPVPPEVQIANGEKNAYDYTLPGADGKDVLLSNFKGKCILIVNLGRKSAYGEQLPGLIKLNDAYKSKGLVVLGVPSNQFGLAEPGTPTEVQKAYADANVDFPVMAVSKITGEDELPLYGYLTKSKKAPAGGPVHWNYTKFIIDKNGNVVARLDPDVAPDSAEMKATIDQVMDGTYKAKKGDAKAGVKPGADEDDDDE